MHGDKVRGTGDSHIMVRVDGKRKYLHVLVAEKKLGRPLEKNEIVHHEDENKHNNDPANLKVLEGRLEHLREHNFHRHRRRRPEPPSDDLDFWMSL